MMRGLATEDWAGLAELRTDVERTLGQRCPDHYELEDLVQETLIKAARSRADLGDPERLRSWVLRIAWNVYRDHVRRQSRHRTYAMPADEMEDLGAVQQLGGAGSNLFSLAGTGLAYDLEDVLSVLRGLIMELGSDDLALYRAFYEQELGCPEIARHLGGSAQSVKMRVFRLRKRLGERMLQRTRMMLGGVEVPREAVA